TAIPGSLDYDTAQLLLHYTGGQWRRVTIPSSLGAVGSIGQVRTIAPDDVWLVLTIPHADQGQVTYTDALVHYHGGSWSMVTPPFPSIGDFAPVSPDELWTIGGSFDEQGWEPDSIAHLQAGSWATTPPPAGTRPGIFHMVTPTDGW